MVDIFMEELHIHVEGEGDEDYTSIDFMVDETGGLCVRVDPSGGSDNSVQWSPQMSKSQVEHLIRFLSSKRPINDETP